MGAFHGMDGEDMEMPEGFEGFTIPIGQLKEGIVLNEMIETLESLKNMMDRIEHGVIHALLLNHDGDEESDEYFKDIQERVDHHRANGEEFWTTAKLRTLYALRDTAIEVCERYAVTAGLDPAELDNGIPD